MFQLLLIIIYLSFISLGLPDSLLGSAWPTIYPQLDVPVSYAGIISMIVALGTIVSSLQSDRLTRRLGTGKVTAVSVAVLIAVSFLCAAGRFALTTEVIGYCLVGMLVLLAVVRTIIFYVMDKKGL